MRPGPACPATLPRQNWPRVRGMSPPQTQRSGVVRAWPAQPSVGDVCGDSRSVCPATLTLLPRVFFDACDGLFTNYNWKEEHLERTRRLAGPRHTDIYVGIDVFARGDVIGGGFDTDKVGVPTLGHRGALGLPLAWGSELLPMAVPCRAMPCR